MNDPIEMLSRPYNSYVYVINGEVVWMHRVDTGMEMMNAIMSSNPTIVAVPEELKESVMQGWTYNEKDNTFSSPE
jgi:hypothetical protein